MPQGKLNPIALGETRSVLAIADFEFMVPPYISLLDNDRLVSNVADFLTAGEREYDLADFPHFYERGQDAGVDILLGRQSLWNIGLAMKNGLSNLGYSARMSGAEDPSRDTVFLGLYDDALQVSRYLQASGIRVGDTLGTPFATDPGARRNLHYGAGTQRGQGRTDGAGRRARGPVRGCGEPAVRRVQGRTG